MLVTIVATYELGKTLYDRFTGLLAAGVCLGLGLLCRYTTFLIYPVLVCCFALGRSFWQFLLHFGVVVLVSACVSAPWFLYAYTHGILEVHVQSVVNFAGKVTIGGGERLMVRTLTARLPSAFGIYQMPFLILGGIYLLRRWHPSDRFVLFWIAPVALLLSVTFPINRFFLPVFPAFSIVAACWLRDRFDRAEQVVLLGLLFCSALLTVCTWMWRNA